MELLIRKFFMTQTFNLKAAINLRSDGAVCLSKAAQLTAAGIARPDIFWIKILSKFDFSFFDTSRTASTMLQNDSDVWRFQKKIRRPSTLDKKTNPQLTFWRFSRWVLEFVTQKNLSNNICNCFENNAWAEN